MIAVPFRPPVFRRLISTILLAAPLGCVDALGIRSACESEMQQVRRQHGPPDQRARGLRSEIWLYGSSSGGFYYEFSWSAAGEPCQVVGPLTQSRLPGTEVISTVSPSPPAAPARAMNQFFAGEKSQ
ncbi:hypothetical protein BH23GEM6_BH23GEM6_02390 [soil metagenome]